MEAIHDLAADDAVAAVVTIDFLRRPAVASKAMADDIARHAVNEAQFDRFRQQAGIDNAVTRGEVDLDEQLEKLLKGSGEEVMGAIESTLQLLASLE
jgi:hypothetical protein